MPPYPPVHTSDHRGLLRAALQVNPTTSEVRARVGDAHPTDYAAKQADGRGRRFELFMIINIQRHWRALLDVRRVQRMQAELRAVRLIQRLIRGRLARKRVASLRGEKDAVTQVTMGCGTVELSRGVGVRK